MSYRRRVAASLSVSSAVIALVALAPASASAWSPVTNCTIDVQNNTSYTMQLYNSVVYGLPIAGATQSIGPGGGGIYSSVSTWPISTHCSINLWWQLQTPDGSGWSQGLETYVYDPNSGHNNAWYSPTGDFAQRTSTKAAASDQGALEVMGVGVYPSGSSGAARDSAAGLRPGGNPLRPVGDAAIRLREPKQVRGLLRRGDLVGRGWARARRIGDLGGLGRILSAAKVPAACQDKRKSRESWPLKQGLSAFSRRGGAEFIGAGQSVYANARQSRRTINDAVSTHSIGCLARLLTSKRFHTSVRTERVGITLAGSRLIFNRLKVSTHSGARIIRTDSIDITGVQHGKANALLMFAGDKPHPDARDEAAAIEAVVTRLP